MGQPVELTAQTFEQAVKQQGIVLIDFWAPWCGPCRVFGPIFERTAQKHPDVSFAKVNTDDQQELATAFEIRGIPTLMVFREGILLFSQAGALPEAALEELITQVRGLDMEKVREEMAQQSAPKS